MRLMTTLWGLDMYKPTIEELMDGSLHGGCCFTWKGQGAGWWGGANVSAQPHDGGLGLSIYLKKE